MTIDNVFGLEHFPHIVTYVACITACDLEYIFSLNMTVNRMAADICL